MMYKYCTYTDGPPYDLTKGKGEIAKPVKELHSEGWEIVSLSRYGVWPALVDLYLLRKPAL